MSLAPGDGLRVAQQRHTGLPGGLWGPQQQAITAGPLQQDGIHADTRPRLLGRVPETRFFSILMLLALFFFLSSSSYFFFGGGGWVVGVGVHEEVLGGGGEKNEEGLRLTSMTKWVVHTVPAKPDPLTQAHVI